jgi:anthranilate phosphoribosyltransferase
MSSDPITFAKVFGEVTGPDGPSPRTVRDAFDAIFSGSWTPAQVAGFVVALRMRGESSSTIAAAASAMRAAMVAVDHGFDATLDTCGTGGDGRGTLNVSTAAAIVASALGIKVAKHGNRAMSSRAGTADVLEALGLPIDLPPDRQAGVLREAGIAFLFAQSHHPAMKHAGPVRRELGIRTIFNILGPLCNPARATHQLLGTYDDKLRPVMAETLRELGTKRAWLVWGEEGIDEVSPSGPTRVSELDGDRIRERVITPEDFGLTRLGADALAGGDAATNAKVIESILRGESHPARGAVVLNAAAALVVAQSIEPKEAAELADRALSSGSAMAALERWRAAALRARAG